MEKYVAGIAGGEKLTENGEWLADMAPGLSFTEDEAVVQVGPEKFSFKRSDLNTLAEELRGDTAGEGREYIQGASTLVIYREDLGYMLDQMDAQ